MFAKNSLQSINPILRSVLPVATIALTTLILYAFRGVLSTTTVALIYLLPVLINTTFWGLGTGIVTAFTAFLVYNFFFLVPYHTFVVHNSQDIVALAIFLLVAILISQLVGQARENLAKSEARERELTHLYELSLALAGVNNVKEIAQVIATQALDSFQAQAVWVEVQPLFGEGKYHAQVPYPGRIPERRPILIASLATARGVLGEIRVWREKELRNPLEERMMRTFASQGAIALERAALAQSETRAKVLEESDRLKTALLSSVSHELRTPLSTIKAAITSLLSDEIGWETPARKELLTAVNEETDLLNRLVGNLLDMSRIETGALRPNRQWNILSEIVDEVMVRMRRVLKNHEVVVDIPEDLPLVPVDYIQIEQVFSNLLSNSAKFAPPGSTIQITARMKDRETLLVQVTNQGPQILPVHLERIFDKFYRFTDADKVSGTGLGLSICKGIIEAHGGTIWAENMPKGIAFMFTLPLVLDGVQPPVIEPEGE